MSQRSGVAAIVVTHNSAATLRHCVDGLLIQPALDALVIVDNGSTDAWHAALPDDSRIQTLRNPDNPGFAHACNQGAAATRADWLLFINPDCFLDDGTLARLLSIACVQPKLGVLGAVLVDVDGVVDPASRRRAPTPQTVLAGKLAAGSTVTNNESEFESVEAISGALMLMPRSAFAAVDGFDAGYRLHCEDLDLCRRLRNAGLDVGIAAGVRVLHLKGTSSRARPIWVEWQKHRGMLRYFAKFDAANTAWPVRLAVYLGVALRLPIAAARAWWRAL